MVILSFVAALRAGVIGLLQLVGDRAKRVLDSRALWPQAIMTRISVPSDAVFPGQTRETGLCILIFHKIKKCKGTTFYDFSLHDIVNDRDGKHKIHTCSSFGN